MLNRGMSLAPSSARMPRWCIPLPRALLMQESLYEFLRLYSLVASGPPSTHKIVVAFAFKFERGDGTRAAQWHETRALGVVEVCWS